MTKTEKTVAGTWYTITCTAAATVTQEIDGEIATLATLEKSGTTTFRASASTVTIQTEGKYHILPTKASAGGGIGGGGNAGGERGPQGPAGKDGKDGTMVQQCIHVSFDDVKNVTAALAAGTLASAWENPFLGMLKAAHEKYGMCFSLYLYQTLPALPTKYQAELGAAADWLKWGVHAISASDYSSATYEKGQSDWNAVVSAVMTLTGSHQAIDRMPRLHMFAGSREALCGMRDASLGALGFLAADDSRPSYYLDAEQNAWLFAENDHLSDFKNALVFYRTDLRLDLFTEAGFSYTPGTNSVHLPTYPGDIARELELRFTNSSFVNTWPCFTIFAHEWQPLSAIRSALEEVGAFAEAHNIEFGFPQEHCAELTAMDIHSAAGDTSIVRKEEFPELLKSSELTLKMSFLSDVNDILNRTDLLNTEDATIYAPNITQANFSSGNNVLKRVTFFSNKSVNVRNHFPALTFLKLETNKEGSVEYCCRSNASKEQVLIAPNATSISDCLGYYQISTAAVGKVCLFAPKATKISNIGGYAPKATDVELYCPSLAADCINVFKSSPLSRESILNFLANLPSLETGVSYTIEIGADAALQSDTAFLNDVAGYYNSATSTGWDVGLTFNAIS